VTAPFRVMTCADADYFHLLPYFEANVERKFGRLPLIYDLGLRDDQRRLLRSDVVRVPVPDGFRGKEPTRGFVMATHKPACIADALKRSPAGCLYADADVLFVEAVTTTDLGVADLAVTPRHPKERTPLHLENGALNTGVLFFTDRPAARSLITTWADACAGGTHTDQKALSDLLSGFALLESLGPETRDGLSLMKLDAKVFNDVRLKTGRVLHFKNAGRDPRVTAKLARYRRLEQRHPHALPAFLAVRRRLGI